MYQPAIHCPHCGRERVAATPRGAYAVDTYAFWAFLTCNACRNGVVARYKFAKYFDDPDGKAAKLLEDPENAAKLIKESRLDEIHPSLPEPRIVDHLPQKVQSALREAEAIFAQLDKPTSAAVSYGRTLERALKTIDPEGKGTLQKRIDKLAENNSLPPSLVELAHEIRYLRNEAVHDVDDVTNEEASALRDFTTLFLIYTFELPGRIEAARQRRKGGGVAGMIE
ncbi:DUF4145 domain-containing protein [Palleronia caenipelagi]|uniref:DUF4145 domain-containing protein n=1 Tax=Palleronia caenipelagi TaxID=2489174 RepID=A0A547Q681_9RHOB|nr:DUF4145 domain-containing protein [Palleronia caenipelagi]TRD21889.1 DUF4145 domain-containing protein [Palleronia caenipelagi]